jgi:uncharacterized protein YbjT (DUF2867 family)
MTIVSAGELVLVAGATGGVGQLTVGKLLEKGLKVRVLTRNAEKAQKMFNGKFNDQLEIVLGDIRNPETLPAVVEGVNYIICCTGTTAFPSTRWEFEQTPSGFGWVQLFLNRENADATAKNSPLKVDAQGVSNLLAAVPKNLKRFVFVSSCGIKRRSEAPWNILNAFGVLDAKEKGEEAIINSGFPYTIIRPARLIDGPFTSYDLNSLLKAKTGGKLGVVLGTGDKLAGETSRIDVAIACVESLYYSSSESKVFEIINKGTRPSNIDWETLFSQL